MVDTPFSPPLFGDSWSGFGPRVYRANMGWLSLTERVSVKMLAIKSAVWAVVRRVPGERGIRYTDYDSLQRVDYLAMAIRVKVA